MLKYYLESTQKERAAMDGELKALYNDLVEQENEAFKHAIEKCTPAEHNKHIAAYNAILSRLGTVQAVFETLHIEYQPGQKFPVDK